MTVPRPQPPSLGSLSRTLRTRALRTRFGRVLALPGAVAFVLPAAVARFGVAMTGLGMLLSIEHATGSYAVAGAATGAFAAAEATAGPQIARVIDRLGQTATLPALAVLHAVALIAALTTAETVPIPVMLALVASAGATVPQPGALSAARWSHLAPDSAALRSAFALEAGINDVVYLGGPVLVTVLGTALAPWAGSAAAGLLLVLGCTILASRRATAPPVRRRERVRGRRGRRGTTLLAPRFVATLGVNAGLGCFFGAVPLLVVAAAREQELEPLAGLVLAVSSGASIIAGLVYGSLRRTPAPHLVQLVAASSLAIAVAVGVALPSLAGLSVMLLIGGTSIAPLLTSSVQIVEATVAPAEITQGFTWINTSSAAGIAASAALTGALIGAHGIGAAILALLGLTLGATASAIAAALGSRTAPRRP